MVNHTAAAAPTPRCHLCAGRGGSPAVRHAPAGSGARSAVHSLWITSPIAVDNLWGLWITNDGGGRDIHRAGDNPVDNFRLTHWLQRALSRSARSARSTSCRNLRCECGMWRPYTLRSPRLICSSTNSAQMMRRSSDLTNGSCSLRCNSMSNLMCGIPKMNGKFAVVCVLFISSHLVNHTPECSTWNISQGAPLAYKSKKVIHRLGETCG